MSDVDQQPGVFGVGRLFWVTSDAIICADIETETIVLWNPAAERILGYSAAEAIGMRLVTLVPEELRDQHLEGIHRFREAGHPKLVGGDQVHVPALTKDGRRIDIALTLSDVSEPGTRRHVLAIVRDVTAERDAERALARNNAAMRDFVATASHDLRTPLTTILGFAHSLANPSLVIDDEQRQEFLQAIIRSGVRASRLVSDLLTLSQLQAEALEAHPEAVNVLAAAQEACRDSDVDALIDVDPHLKVLADADHVHRILVNYISNASEYGAPPFQVGASRRGEQVAIEVSDEGDGVPESFRGRLFDAFARAKIGEGRGTGLGLSIVKGLAEVNGGSVWYEPRRRGSCFAVLLPAEG